MRIGGSDAGGSDDLIVDVDRSSTPASPKLDAKVAAACKRDPTTKMASFLPPPSRTRLVFTNTGDAFVATNGTTRTLESWKAEAGAHGHSFLQMVGAGSGP